MGNTVKRKYQFRLEDILAARCQALASERQLSLSEWAREVLRREVEMRSTGKMRTKKG